jgi:hypothetical protein
MIDFFITFARFEFALKQSGFVHGDEAKVSPDWDGFSRVMAHFDDATLAPVLESCPYLRENPPKKQILKNGRLAWVQPARSQSEIQNLLLNVRTVRNNVFHGGKFPLPVGPVAEPLRDCRLLQDCLSCAERYLGDAELAKRLGR